MKKRSQELHQLGQSLWYDNIERRLLRNGELAGMVKSGLIYGVTSNPSIFNNAIAKASDYDEDLTRLAAAGKSPTEIYEALAFEDIRAATDLFLPVYEATAGRDGYVSIEVNPDLAHDTEATCEEALRIWHEIERPNLMVKIPATRAGIPAVQRSIAAGLNINITLIFSLQRYREVMDAYMAGLEQRIAQGQPIDRIASVASFFVSRIDTKADEYLETLMQMEGTHVPMAPTVVGQVAVANARLAYRQFKRVFSGERFTALKEEGACLQRPLWASTSTKNPGYSDVKYVEELIGPDTVNTLPPNTLHAFEDHGQVAPTLEQNVQMAEGILHTLEELGVSMNRITLELEREGVTAFSRAFADLLATIEMRAKEALPVDARTRPKK